MIEVDVGLQKSLRDLIHGSGLMFPSGSKGAVSRGLGRWVVDGLDRVDGYVDGRGGRLRGMYLISGVPESGLWISIRVTVLSEWTHSSGGILIIHE
jgi:hypothetical protein